MQMKNTKTYIAQEVAITVVVITQQIVGKYGDAVYETSTSGSGSTSWYSDYASFPYTSSPFFKRGGSHSTGSTDSTGSTTGAFYFVSANGSASADGSFRPVLVAY